jgi:hypothetical protein
MECVLLTNDPKPASKRTRRVVASLPAPAPRTERRRIGNLSADFEARQIGGVPIPSGVVMPLCCDYKKGTIRDATRKVLGVMCVPGNPTLGHEMAMWIVDTCNRVHAGDVKGVK